MYFRESDFRGAGKRPISKFPEDRPIGPGAVVLAAQVIPAYPLGSRPSSSQSTDENLFESHGIEDARQIGFEGSTMNTLRVVRNLLGTAGLLFAGYVFLMSIRDTRRYIKISAM
jgi:hypothetical protein